MKESSDGSVAVRTDTQFSFEQLYINIERSVCGRSPSPRPHHIHMMMMMIKMIWWYLLQIYNIRINHTAGCSDTSLRGSADRFKAYQRCSEDGKMFQHKKTPEKCRWTWISINMKGDIITLLLTSSSLCSLFDFIVILLAELSWFSFVVLCVLGG